MEAKAASTSSILQAVMAGRRIDETEALRLFEDASLPDLSAAASAVRRRLNDPARVSFVVDRNVNYTDVCNVYCTFCAFYHKPGSRDGYLLTREQLRRKAEETKAVGGTGFLLQGGVNPDLPWSYYLDLCSYLRSLGIWVHGFSPVEIQMMARLNGLGLEETLRQLRDAGLGSLPGAVVGGILLGILETFVSAYVSSVIRDVFSFSLLVLLLMVMPTGLFGRFLEEKV